MTIDLDEIESRINDGIYGDDRMTDTARDDAFSALAVLLAEVERLLDEEAYRLQLLDDAGGLENERDGQRKRADSLALAYREQQGENDALRIANTNLRLMVDGLETAAHSERAAVVAWLQAASQRWAVDDPLNEAADAIERGEHRRKEEA